MTSVAGSSSQYCSRSLLDTSALFPILTKVERPIFRLFTYSRIACPRAPLWEPRAIFPGGGKTGEKVPFIFTFASVLMTPRQLGPIRRIL